MTFRVTDKTTALPALHCKGALERPKRPTGGEQEVTVQTPDTHGK